MLIFRPDRFGPVNLTIIAIMLISIIFPLVNTAESTGDTSRRSSSEPWIISDEQYINNTDEIWSRDIQVLSGGSLVFDNATIHFETVNSPINITVSSGGLLKIINSSEFFLNKISSSYGYYITVYGDLVIENSSIMFAGYAPPPNSSSCNPTQVKWNFMPGIRLVEGTAAVRNAEIRNSTYGIELENAKLDVYGSTFVNNFYGIYGYHAENMKVTDTKFSDNFYGLFMVSSINMIVEECIFKTNYFGVFSDNSEIGLINSTFQTNNEGGISAYRQSEIVLEDCDVSDDIDKFPGYNIFIEDSTLKLEDCLSVSGLWGVYLMNATAELVRTELLDNMLTGLYAQNSDITVTNSTLMGNDYGAIIENSTGTFQYNTITDNGIGLFAVESAPVIDYNTITRNTEYGVQSRDGSFELGAGNVFSDSENKTNGLGMMRELCTVFVQATDPYNNWFTFIDSIVINAFGEEVFNDSLYVKGDMNGGKLQLEQKLISNEGVSSSKGPHDVIIRWGRPEWGGYISASKKVTCGNDGPHIVRMQLPLPDLYITENDIEVSSSNIREGDSVKLSAIVHSAGPLNPTNTNVTFYINDRYTERILIDSFDGAETYTVSINAKAEIDDTSEQFRVRVEVENHEFEVNYFMDPYKANNTASRSIEISSVDSGEELMSYYARFGFIAMAVIIFVIVVVLVVKYLFVVQRPPEESEDSEDESKEDSGKKGKGPGRKPPVKVEPPEMVRRL
jgi:hypothetical protein